jgi:hypothetical protein
MRIQSIQLTKKHIIVFYNTGRIEWLIKFYPELLEEDSALKPFQIDKYYQSTRRIMHGMYDHQFQNLLIAYEEGFFGYLKIIADSNEAEEEYYEEDNKKKPK